MFPLVENQKQRSKRHLWLELEIMELTLYYVQIHLEELMFRMTKAYLVLLVAITKLDSCPFPCWTSLLHFKFISSQSIHSDLTDLLAVGCWHLCGSLPSCFLQPHWVHLHDWLKLTPCTLPTSGRHRLPKLNSHKLFECKRYVFLQCIVSCVAQNWVKMPVNCKLICLWLTWCNKVPF